MGHWDSFWDRGELFKCDRLHRNWRGTFAMGQCMHALGGAGLFKQGNRGAGRIESERGREAQTAQMDTVIFRT